MPSVQLFNNWTPLLNGTASEFVFAHFAFIVDGSVLGLSVGLLGIGFVIAVDVKK